jgi:hypothetical protein
MKKGEFKKMKNRYDVECFKKYGSNVRKIVLFKNDEQINIFETKDIDIENIKSEEEIDALFIKDIGIEEINYPNVIKELALNCYKKSLKAEIRRKVENEKKLLNDDLLSFRNKRNGR